MLALILVYLLCLAVLNRFWASISGELFVIGTVITLALLIFTPAFLLARRFLSPASAATVYENGLVLKRGSKMITQPFHGLKTIEFMPFTLDGSLYKINTITLIKKDGSKPIVARIPAFKEFAPVLRTVFMQYKEQNAA